MSNRKILNAAATGGIGYYPVGNPTDAYYDNVSLLLNGDVEVDSNFANVSLLLDGNVLTDKSNNKAAVTAYGNAAVTSVNKKFGTGSYYFDGNGDYLSVPSSSNFTFGTGDFTIEFWASFNSLSQQQLIIDFRPVGSNGVYPALYISNSILYYYTNSTNAITSSTLFANVWYHVSVTRNGSNTKLFINGVQVGSTYVDSTNYSNGAIIIGASGFFANGTDSPFTGYIDDFRITKGIARYTANFTPPVKAFPTHEILDSSVYRLPVTPYGNARIDATTKKFGTSAMYFDGSGDYINIATTNALTIGTGDFTYEAWIHPLNLQASKAAGEKCIYYTGQNGILISLWNNNVHLASDFVADLADFSSTTVVNGSWFHLAITRSGTTVSCFINGQQTGSSVTLSTNFGTNGLNIGRYSNASMEFQGYMDDLRITKGIARYTTNFTPPLASLPTIPPTIPADPWWGNVSLLLDGNTTDAYDPYWQNVSLMLTGDDFVDWSNQHNSITNNGSVTLSTATKKFNSSSLAFSGSNYLTLPNSVLFNFGTGDFTVEGWFYFTAIPTSTFPSLFQVGSGLYFNFRGGSTIALTDATTVYAQSSSGITPNSWHYIAVVRGSGVSRVYVDGTSGASVTCTANFGQAAAYIFADPNVTNFNTGYLTDFRVTKGIARYTANFTPPTAALPSYKIQDRTQNNLTLTPYGNVQLSTDVMKNGTGSMFFDGSDYLSLSSTEIIGNGNYTIEFWLNIANSAGCGMILGTQLCHWQLGYDSNGYYLAYFNMSADYNANQVSSVRGVYGSWTHIAASRIGNTTSVYYNGVYGGGWSETLPGVSGGASQIGHSPRYSGNYLTGYIDDLRITNGYARYTQNFTPPSQSFATQYISTGYDANYADVSLLLNGNGTNGSQVFTDLSGTPKTITAYGNAQISTAVKKYGTGAMYFDGTGDYLSIPPSLIDFTADFTIELWYYPISLVTGAAIISGTSETIYIGHGSGTQGTLDAWFNGTKVCGTNSSGISLSAWNHIAFTRSGSTCTLFVNGTNVSSGTKSGPNTVPSNLYIGTWSGNVGAYVPQAYIDDFRITKGIARYTTNFTPPTYQLPTDSTDTVIDPLRSSTSLLLRGNGTNGSTSFTDESPNGLTVTNNGSVTVNTTTKKYGTGSMAFSGSNYLALTSNAALALGTGDFTVEMWLYTTGTPNDWSIIESRTDGNAATVNGFTLTALSSSVIRIYSNGALIASSATTYLNQWVHVAVTRYSGTWNLFINGVSQGTSTSSRDMTNTDLIIGGGRYGSTSAVTSYYTGYIDDLRITKGYARYTSNFTPPTYEDPIVTGTVYDYNYPQVSLLLNGDGTNGSTTFTDLSSSPKTITAYGNAQISTAVKKYGTGSMSFDGTGDYLTLPASTDWFLGISDFTIEMWINTPSPYSNFRFGPLGQTDPINGRWMIRTRTSVGQLGFAYSLNGSTYADISSGLTLPSNTWCHIAIVRQSGVFKFFLDGIKGTDYSAGTSDSLGLSGYPLYIGRNVWDGNLDFPGYIDDLRITKGIARYTQNFTPPTAPLPTSYS